MLVNIPKSQQFFFFYIIRIKVLCQAAPRFVNRSGSDHSLSGTLRAFPRAAIAGSLHFRGPGHVIARVDFLALVDRHWPPFNRLLLWLVHGERPCLLALLGKLVWRRLLPHSAGLCAGGGPELGSCGICIRQRHVAYLLHNLLQSNASSTYTIHEIRRSLPESQQR